MNYPLPKTMTPVRAMEFTPISDVHAATNMTPLEADILREEREARAKRTATPLEVFDTLIQSQHEVRQVNHTEFLNTLSRWEWPEEQSQGVPAGVVMTGPCVIKLFKGPDGFAMKTVPVVDSRMVTERVVYEVFTLVKP